MFRIITVVFPPQDVLGTGNVAGAGAVWGAVGPLGATSCVLVLLMFTGSHSPSKELIYIYHISHVKFKKQDTSSPKVATFCKRLDFCFQEWYSTLSSGKCYINPLHTVWDSHPSRNSNINVQSPCISVVFSYGFLATELGSFCRFVVRLKKKSEFFLGCSTIPPNPRNPAWHRFLLLEVAHPLGHPGGTS